MTPPVLAVEDLSVEFRRRGKRLPVLDSVSFEIHAGETYGLVGESGCGKSTIALAIMRYLSSNGRVSNGKVWLDGKDFLGLDARALQGHRGRTLAMVYQDPASALNPSLRIGEQIAEMYRVHDGSPRLAALARARDDLERVRISDAGRVLRRYPHQLSGGQQQRVVIAMALAGNPRLLILDEPTTGLDATVEAEVLDLIAGLRTELQAAVLFISHNLGLIARMCERVGVLYAGRIVEEGDAREVLRQPRHPYTMGLLRCVPRFGARKSAARLYPIPGSLPPLGALPPGCTFEPRCVLATAECREAEPPLFGVDASRQSRCYHHDRVPGMPVPEAGARAPVVRPTVGEGVLLSIRGVRKSYRELCACDDVCLDVGRGEVLGLVGESGSGKSTLAKAVVGLAPGDAGCIVLEDQELPGPVGRRDQNAARALQMVFQHPDSTLNPRHSARSILRRAITRLGGRRSVDELARAVRLEPLHLQLRAGELSGGLKQRVAIGRAFAGTPALVVCDEPVSALDVSVQAAILNLLADLQEREGVSYVFISHDLAVVRYLSDRIAVMYLGQILEVGAADEVFNPPHHPYTEALLSAIPTLDLEVARPRIRLDGPIPSLAELPSGCRFHTRCHRKLGEVCELEEPPTRDAGNGHMIRCHIPVETLRELQAHEEARASATG